MRQGAETRLEEHRRSGGEVHRERALAGGAGRRGIRAAIQVLSDAHSAEGVPAARHHRLRAARYCSFRRTSHYEELTACMLHQNIFRTESFARPVRLSTRAVLNYWQIMRGLSSPAQGGRGRRCTCPHSGCPPQHQLPQRC